MTKVTDVISWAKGLADQGQGVDFDGWYGTQCVDLPNWILGKFFGKSIWGNAIDLLGSAQEAGYEVIYDAPGVNPKAGDLFVMSTYAHPYGHTGLVISDSDGYTLHTIEQNIDGNADSLTIGGPARYAMRGFSDATGQVLGWIRPPYSQEVYQGSTSPEVDPTDWRKIKDEQGTMTVQVAAVRVRNTPSVSGEIVATYGYGMSFVYDSVYVGDGYIWVSYISQTGVRRYVACGKEENGRNVAPFGSFA